MAMLKSYTCSKCAGVLLFDSDQEFFDCPFCGTKFSAADFHGNEIMDQAKDCQRKRSFDAAKEKYYAVLENDPDNFDAHFLTGGCYKFWQTCSQSVTSHGCQVLGVVVNRGSLVVVSRCFFRGIKKRDTLLQCLAVDGCMMLIDCGFLYACGSISQ